MIKLKMFPNNLLLGKNQLNKSRAFHSENKKIALRVLERRRLNGPESSIVKA